MASYYGEDDEVCIGCMKHSRVWMNRIQWLTNKFRDNLIDQKYIRRFHKILCTCTNPASVQLQPRVDVWEDISDDQLTGAVTFIDNFITSNISSPHTPVLMDIMKRLRNQCQVVEPPPTEHGISCFVVTGPRSSAYKLLYLLQRILEGDFTLLEPPRLLNDPNNPQKEEMELTFDLEGFNHGYLGNLIGREGSSLLRFMKRHLCRIELKKVLVTADDYKVVAKITKKVIKIDTLERIQKEFEEFSNRVQEEEDIYAEDRRNEEKRQKKDFTEILKELKNMGKDADWNNIITDCEKTQRFHSCRLNHVDIDILKGWFNEVQARWEEIQDEVKAATQGTAVQAVQATGATEVPATATLVAAASGSSPAQSSTQQNNIAVSENTQTVQLLSKASHCDSTAAASPGQPSIQSPGAAGPQTMTEEQCPTACLVHDRRWMPTYQFTLNQCYTHVKLPRKDGRTFSRLVCTCDAPKPEPYLYFENEDSLRRVFSAVRNMIQNCWPRECSDILQPLLRQMDKFDKADTWYSLVKFVYFLDRCREGQLDALNSDHKLPGEGKSLITPRAEQVRPHSSTLVQKSSPVACCSHHTSRFLSQTTIPKPVVKPLKKVSHEDWSEDCYFHGKKKKFVFQCVLNYLHKFAGLAVKLNIPFSLAVCCCNEVIAFKDYYNTEQQAVDDCIYMKGRLTQWRGDSKVSVQPLIKSLDEYIKNKNISDGFLKFVYFFNKAYKKENTRLNEILQAMKTHRN